MLSIEKGLKADMESHLKDQVLFLLFMYFSRTSAPCPTTGRESPNRLSFQQQEFVAD